MTDTDEAPGWDAIDLALNAWYEGITPHHVGYQPPAAFSANLQGCSAYPAADHWHYVTYGLSELYHPGPNDDPEWSGWGFELTFRPARRPDEVQAPGWPFGVLNQLAKHVNTNKVLLEPGHRIDLGQPITGHPHVPDAPATGLTVFALTVDPQLGTIDTPHGKVVLLQAVGVTAQEKAVMLESSTAAVLEELAARNPLLITDPARAS
ncbi:suppressor of fused domain protein [Amycolatopsis sp. 195334CR]|uniref:suppressor of fused domain protein n=1 Tax=Amycolatopsis sp. 195334CR TaxID=2814588 RepID=UPI001A8E8E2C|nr:suppressor of fused domain protein [Amycolatopsis sp. 195334CR]MBN6039972.1 suppressor of fused domain protein [Amycolatopsis sp. 195334CR]